MSDFVIFATAWVVSGFLGMFLIAYENWEKGYDITVKEAIIDALAAVIFGATVWLYLVSKFILSVENKVLIKGKKRDE